MKDIIYSLGEKQRIRLIVDLVVQNPECAKQVFSGISNLRLKPEYEVIQPLVDFILNEEVSSDPNLYMLQLASVHCDIKDEEISWMLLDSMERMTEFLSQNVPDIRYAI